MPRVVLNLSQRLVEAAAEKFSVTEADLPEAIQQHLRKIIVERRSGQLREAALDAANEEARRLEGEL